MGMVIKWLLAFFSSFWMRAALFILYIIAPILRKVFAALGVGFITFVGLGQVLSGIESYVQGLFNQIPYKILTILGLAQLDIAINILLSALAARLTVVTMSKILDAPMRKMGWKAF